MIDAIRGRARLIRAGILSASVLAFIPILGLVKADTPADSTAESTAIAPPTPTPAPATTNSYRRYDRDGADAPRYSRVPGQQSTSPAIPAPPAQAPAPSSQSQAPAPHTRSRGS